MIVLVKWQEHGRQYSIGLKQFLDKLGVNVENEKIEATVKKLLEQEEMTSVYPEH